MSTRLIVAATLAIACSGQTAVTQTIPIGRSHAPPGTAFLAGYSHTGSSGPLSGRWITEFYRAYGPDPGFTARRALAAADGPAQIQVISEQDCPALAMVMESLNGLSMPTVRVFNLSRQPAPVPFFPAPAVVTTDAPSYAIWATGLQADGYFAELSVSSGSGIIAGWGAFADQMLAACWSPSPGRDPPHG